MITVSGRTMPHRETLRRMGGRWHNAEKYWSFDRLNKDQIATLRATVGLFVAEGVERPEPKPEPKPSIDFAALIAALQDETPVRVTNSRPATVYGDDPTYLNRFADQNPSAFFGFSGLGKLISYIEGLHADIVYDPGRAGWGTQDAEWCGSANMPEAISIARDGWHEGVDQALAIIDRLTLESPRVRRRKPSLAGGQVSVGRMLAGDPAHMIRRPRQPGSKVITFFVEAGCSGSIRADTLVIRAAAIGAMVDLMENVGYSCTIVTVDTSIGMDRRPIYQLAVTLKEAGERLNLPDLMFALGHPSFLRRFSFAACSSVPETRTIWRDQGSPSNSFDDEHPCGKSEFYIPVLTDRQQSRLTDDPLSMLAMITPATLPVQFVKEE
jgi:hypothetical protein